MADKASDLPCLGKEWPEFQPLEELIVKMDLQEQDTLIKLLSEEDIGSLASTCNAISSEINMYRISKGLMSFALE